MQALAVMAVFGEAGLALYALASLLHAFGLFHFPLQ